MGSRKFSPPSAAIFTITSCYIHDFPSKIGAAGEFFYDFCTCFTDFTVFESNFREFWYTSPILYTKKTVSSESVYQILVYIYQKKTLPPPLQKYYVICECSLRDADRWAMNCHGLGNWIWLLNLNLLDRN